MAACGSVKDDDPDARILPDASTADAATPGVTITLIDQPPTEVGGISSLMAILAGEPGEDVDCVVTTAPAGGAYVPANGTVPLDVAGNGVFTADFAAPGTEGTYTQHIACTDVRGVTTEEDFDAVVIPATLVSIGYPDPIVNTGAFSPNYLFAIEINVPTASTLRTFGIIGQSAGANVRMGLYTNAGGNPGALVSQMGPVAILGGAQEVDVSPVSLPAGTYFLAANFDVDAQVGQDNNVPITIRYIDLPFATGLPINYGAPMTYSSGAFNLYIQVTASTP